MPTIFLAPGEISTGEVGKFQPAKTGEYSTDVDSWRPNRTPTRSCDTSNGSRDTIRRNCTPGLVWRFGLAGAKSTCTKDYARGIGPVEVLSVLRPVPTRSFARVRH